MNTITFDNFQSVKSSATVSSPTVLTVQETEYVGGGGAKTWLRVIGTGFMIGGFAIQFLGPGGFAASIPIRGVGLAFNLMSWVIP